jgi:hypothetical protein
VTTMSAMLYVTPTSYGSIQSGDTYAGLLEISYATVINNPYAKWNLESISDNISVFVFLIFIGAFLAGKYGERWRARRARRKWQERLPTAKYRGVGPLTSSSAPPVTDSSDQLRIVMQSSFQKRRILSPSEARVFYTAEKAIASANLKWRVMAQVSLGEVLSSPDALAYSTINSKRVDLLIISSKGEPLAAIEFQGSGHYQGTAPARDAVKKEALRRAGVRYIEVSPEHGADHLEREILRLAMVEQSKPAPRTA